MIGLAVEVNTPYVKQTNKGYNFDNQFKSTILSYLTLIILNAVSFGYLRLFMNDIFLMQVLDSLKQFLLTWLGSELYHIETYATFRFPTFHFFNSHLEIPVLSIIVEVVT